MAVCLPEGREVRGRRGEPSGSGEACEEGSGFNFVFSLWIVAEVWDVTCWGVRRCWGGGPSQGRGDALAACRAKAGYGWWKHLLPALSPYRRYRKVIIFPFHAANVCGFASLHFWEHFLPHERGYSHTQDERQTWAFLSKGVFKTGFLM